MSPRKSPKDRSLFLNADWEQTIKNGKREDIEKLLKVMSPNAARVMDHPYAGRTLSINWHSSYYSREKNEWVQIMEGDMGMSALMYAVRAKNIDTTRALISAGANIEQKDNLGRTALMVAISRQFSDIKITANPTIRILIEAGADVNSIDNHDGTAIDIRHRNKVFDLNLTKILLLAGFIPQKEDCDVLLYCIQNCFTKEALMLMEHGARISINYAHDFNIARPCFEQIARTKLDLLKSSIKFSTEDVRDLFEFFLLDFCQDYTHPRKDSTTLSHIAQNHELPEALQPGGWPIIPKTTEIVKIKRAVFLRFAPPLRHEFAWPEDSDVAIVAKVKKSKPTIANDKKFDIVINRFIKNQTSIPFVVLANAREQRLIDFWSTHSSALYKKISYSSRRDGIDSKDLKWLLDSVGFGMLPGILNIGIDDPTLVLDTLLRLEVLPIPELMSQWSIGDCEAAIAKRWFRDFIVGTVHKLLPDALSEHRNKRRAAILILLSLCEHGHRELIDEVASIYGAKDALAIVLISGPEIDIISLKEIQLPSYWLTEIYPAPKLVASGKYLPSHAIETMAKMMLASTVEKPILELQQVLTLLDKKSVAEFSWSLFENWVLRGKKNSDGLFQALGYLGDDECAKKLTQYILEWPKQHYSHRASLGLEILARIGSHTAWRQIQTIAFKSKLGAIAGEAEYKFSRYAISQMLTSSEFEDLLIPSLGLGIDGTFALDVGSELFSVSVDEQLRPILRDGLGTLLGSLPLAGRGNDRELNIQTAMRLSDFRSSLVLVATYELRRLELAMIESKRWRGDQFIGLLASHPLMQNTVRSLVWCLGESNDGSGSIEFAADSDGNFCDLEGLPVVVAENASVVIPHPLNMEKSLCEWKEVFSQRKQRQPFAQLVRKFFRREDDVGQDLFGFQRARVPSTDLYALEALPGWGREHDFEEGSADDGYVTKFFRNFISGRVDLEVVPGGFGHDYKYRSNEQVLTFELPLTLTQEDFSELVRELATATTGVKLKLPQTLKVLIAPLKLSELGAPCPACKGLVKEGAEGYLCVGPQDGKEGQGCGFAFKKTHAGRIFSEGEAELLVRDGRIGPLRGFISKTGTSFSAQMCFMFNSSSQNYRLQFDFGKDNKSDQAATNVNISKQTSLGKCPKCSGDVYEQERDYVCANSVVSPANPKPSCDFKTGRSVLQQPLSQEQIGKLLISGRTDMLDGFMSSRTQKRFSAMLVWDAQARKVNFKFESKS